MTALVVEAPFAPVHAEDCKGICPTCGADRNVEECGCRREPQPSPFDEAQGPLPGTSGESTGADVAPPGRPCDIISHRAPARFGADARRRRATRPCTTRCRAERNETRHHAGPQAKDLPRSPRLAPWRQPDTPWRSPRNRVPAVPSAEGCRIASAPRAGTTRVERSSRPSSAIARTPARARPSGGRRRRVLEGFLAPRSVAVVGAAREEGKVGHFVFDNLLAGGFAGPVYPVNPKADRDPRPPLLRLARATVPGDVGPRGDRRARRGRRRRHRRVRRASACRCGHRHLRRASRRRARRARRSSATLLEAARAGGVRILGPNCLGLIATPRQAQRVASPASCRSPGGIAFMSQSGALGTAILDWAAGEGIGLAYFVSLGNKADVSEVDFLEAWARRPARRRRGRRTSSPSRDGAAFVARRVRARRAQAARRRSSPAAPTPGARAVSSHTGSLAGSEAAYDAAFRSAGVIRARTVQELFDFAVAFARQPLPAGAGVAILTNAGGPAIMATDACERARRRARLARAATRSTRCARRCRPPPRSTTPSTSSATPTPTRYRDAARIARRGPERARAARHPHAAGDDRDRRDGARRSRRSRAESGKTTLACFMGEVRCRAGVARAARRATSRTTRFPERAVAALGGHGALPRASRDSRARRPPIDGRLDGAVAAAIEPRARARGRSFITEEARRARSPRAYGIPHAAGRARRATSRRRRASPRTTSATRSSMKIASPDILHKSDIGGIRARHRGRGRARRRVRGHPGRRARRACPTRRCGASTVQEMITGGTRGHRRRQPRPARSARCCMFGLGGVYVEVLKDVTFRLCPVTAEEAREMISEIRSYRAAARRARAQRRRTSTRSWTCSCA